MANKLTPAMKRAIDLLTSPNGDLVYAEYHSRRSDAAHRVIDVHDRCIGFIHPSTLKALVKRGLVEESEYGAMGADGKDALFPCWMLVEATAEDAASAPAPAEATIITIATRNVWRHDVEMRVCARRPHMSGTLTTEEWAHAVGLTRRAAGVERMRAAVSRRRQARAAGVLTVVVGEEERQSLMIARMLAVPV